MWLAVPLGCAPADPAAVQDTAPAPPTEDLDGDGHAEDCDDADPSVFPGATERCDTEGDDDCDGEANEPGASGCVVSCPDADGDGFGDAARPGECACIPGGVADCTDCDDTRAWIGTECEIEAAPIRDAAWLFSDDDTRDAGSWASPAGDVNGDGVDDLLIDSGDCYDRTGGLFAGPVDGDRDFDGATVTIGGGKSCGAHNYEEYLEGGWDFDGDDVPDALRSIEHCNTHCSGSASVLPGAEFGAATLMLLAPGGRILAHASPDLTGNGTPDVAARVGDYQSWDTDGIAILDGPFEDYPQTSAFIGQSSGAFLTPTAPGDLDGDGIADLLLGDFQVDDDAGVVYVHLGPFTEASVAEEPHARIGGAEPGAQVYRTLGVGDVDGDGTAEFLVLNHSGDVVRRVSGSVAGAVSIDSLSTLDVRAPIRAAAGLGDIDADGYADIAFSQETSAVSIGWGPSPSDLDGPRWIGPYDCAGDPLVNVGDVDADGVVDVIAGLGCDWSGPGGAWLLRGSEFL